ncbi:hypothetical protein M5K25_021799 [Dendrobium thyrsiflorum]|uniref:Uncharacterized protein n=1 Tax=Dendrobium thyrsiflorum TaxID=117978 RepID=A0ABD0UAG9_DENTH
MVPQFGQQAKRQRHVHREMPLMPRNEAFQRGVNIESITQGKEVSNIKLVEGQGNTQISDGRSITKMRNRVAHRRLRNSLKEDTPVPVKFSPEIFEKKSMVRFNEFTWVQHSGTVIRAGWALKGAKGAREVTSPGKIDKSPVKFDVYRIHHSVVEPRVFGIPFDPDAARRGELKVVTAVLRGKNLMSDVKKGSSLRGNKTNRRLNGLISNKGWRLLMTGLGGVGLIMKRHAKRTRKGITVRIRKIVNWIRVGRAYEGVVDLARLDGFRLTGVPASRVPTEAPASRRGNFDTSGIPTLLAILEMPSEFQQAKGRVPLLKNKRFTKDKPNPPVPYHFKVFGARKPEQEEAVTKRVKLERALESPEGKKERLRGLDEGSAGAKICDQSLGCGENSEGGASGGNSERWEEDPMEEQRGGPPAKPEEQKEEEAMRRERERGSVLIFKNTALKQNVAPFCSSEEHLIKKYKLDGDSILSFRSYGAALKVSSNIALLKSKAFDDLHVCEPSLTSEG